MKPAVALIPPLALLGLMATYAVNVPRWDDWGFIPFVLAVDDGKVTASELWAQHNEHRLTTVKLIAAPLVMATRFDVRAMMYAGFALQLTALFLFLSLVRKTLPAAGRWPEAALSFAVALLMFSPAQHENWLWALTAVQWHVCNAAAAGVVWLLARRPRPGWTLPACFLLTAAGMLAVASGIVLWATVLVALVTESAVERRRPPAVALAAWGIGALAFAATLASLRANPGPPYVSYSLAHPQELAAFVLVYLGNPLAQGMDLRLIGLAGMIGLVFLAVVVHAAVVRRFLPAAILPWAWLSIHALLVALATGVGRTRFGIFVATTNRYTTGALFFWIGLLAIAAIALPRLLADARPPVARALQAAAAALAVAAVVNHARLYQEGLGWFVQTHHDRRVALAELLDYENAPDEALTLLYPPSAESARQYARQLEARGLGPFAPRMVSQRDVIRRAIAAEERVRIGQGALQPPQCTMITGWAWSPARPDVPVMVKIYEGDEVLATVPAYWYRRDLVAAGIGDGRHAFLYAPPLRLKDGRPRAIRARIQGTGRDLPGSPGELVCSDRRSVLVR